MWETGPVSSDYNAIEDLGNAPDTDSYNFLSILTECIGLLKISPQSTRAVRQRLSLELFQAVEKRLAKIAERLVRVLVLILRRA